MHRSLIVCSLTFKAPCMDAQLATVFTEDIQIRKASRLKDDQSNSARLFSILGGIIEERKVAPK